MSAVLDTGPATARGDSAAPSRHGERRALVALGRDEAIARPVPNGRRTLGIAETDRRPQGLRRPRVAVRPERTTSALLLREHGIEILALDAVDVPDFDGRYEAALDPVTDRLGGQLELLGDLLDREDLLVLGCIGHARNQISKNSVLW